MAGGLFLLEDCIALGEVLLDVLLSHLVVGCCWLLLDGAG